METSSLPDKLAHEAREWAASDPDPVTREYVLALLDRAQRGEVEAVNELADCFRRDLAFGTAGLRAAMGPGPNRMNRAVVRRTASGFAKFLREAVALTPASPPLRVVVGYDARHNSAEFANETVKVLTAAGIQTLLMPSALPTPLLAYAVRYLDCEGGVMVTASHNPASDNGYKVYLGGRVVSETGRGAQIVSPYDAQIAACIRDTGAIESIPLAENGWTVLDPGLAAEYEAAVNALINPRRFPSRDLKIVYTPLHGVGGRTLANVLDRAGFADVVTVHQQALPDPDFPTVTFPNPEEPGTLDLALEYADEHDADLVLATDPDADRAAAAVQDHRSGAWRILNGDEVGALLAHHMISRAPNGTEASMMANSIVSSRLLAHIAIAGGLGHEETLTGFKWICRVPDLVYGYEEALGYCVAPSIVRDKDGISAAVLLAELAAATKTAGRSLLNLLDDLYLEHGLHVTDQVAIRVQNLAQIDSMMDRLRASPPASFAGLKVKVIKDLAEGSDGMPPTNGLLYITDDDTRVVIRPSGTEPKLKCYIEVVRDVNRRADLPHVTTLARDVLESVKRSLHDELSPPLS